MRDKSARPRRAPKAEHSSAPPTVDLQEQVAALKRPLAPVTVTPDTVKLPKTATDAELKMIIGSILLSLSLILLAFNRRRMFVR